MSEPTLSEDKALDLMEQCLVQGLKEWAVVTDLKVRVEALEHVDNTVKVGTIVQELKQRVYSLEKDMEQMYHESKGNGP